MKKFIILSIFMLVGLSCVAAGYLGTKLPLNGDTICDVKSQANILGYVYSRTSQYAKKCHYFSLVDTKVTKNIENEKINVNGNRIGGTWQEEWTVNACGTKIVVPIDLEQKTNGIKFIINQPKL